MKEIKLTQGFVAIVDDEDFEELSQYRWHYTGRTAGHRFPILEGTRVMLMHVYLMGKIKGLEIDHINRNPLDNRKENLRRCTRSQNESNKGKSKGSSTYKGVYWHKGGEKWMAYIKQDGKRYHLGLHEDEKEAARAYNEAAIKRFGVFAFLNEIEPRKIQSYTNERQESFCGDMVGIGMITADLML